MKIEQVELFPLQFFYFFSGTVIGMTLARTMALEHMFLVLRFYIRITFSHSNLLDVTNDKTEQ